VKPKCAKEVARALGRPVRRTEALAIEAHLTRALRQDRAADPAAWAGRTFEARVLAAAERLARDALGQAHAARNALGRRPGQTRERAELFQDGEGGPRGETAIPEGGIFADPGVVVSLFETADRSTPFHEFGHVYLELYKAYAARENAPAALLDDWAALKAWLGLDDAGEIPTAAHEKFARGFEAYLREGRPPSPGLAGAFAAFKAWLTAIYRSVLALDVELSPEIRAVFDRLIKDDPDDGLHQSRLLEPGAGAERARPGGEPPPAGADDGRASGVRPGPGRGHRSDGAPGADPGRTGDPAPAPRSLITPALAARDPELAAIAGELAEARAEIDALERQGLIQPGEAAAARADLVTIEKAAARPELYRAAAFCLMHGARVSPGGPN